MTAEVPTLAHRLAEDGLLPQIYRFVEVPYPEEGCGFVFEAEDGRLSVVQTTNRATQLHQKDPVAYPRDGRDYFEPDMKPWLRHLREGWTPRVVFHSHPEVGAYFSETDRSSALFTDEDGAVWERNPGVVHLVVSVRNADDPRADGAKLFEYVEETTQFGEIAAFDAAGQVVA